MVLTSSDHCTDMVLISSSVCCSEQEDDVKNDMDRPRPDPSIPSRAQSGMTKCSYDYFVGCTIGKGIASHSIGLRLMKAVTDLRNKEGNRRII